MAGPGGSYQPKVGIIHGADVFFVDDNGYMQFAGTNFTGLQLYEALQKSTLENTAKVTIGQGATSTVLSVVNIPARTAKYIIISMTSTCTQASMWLTSVPAIGRELYIWIARGSCASGSVAISTSGCSIVGLHTKSDISVFHLRNSTTSTGRVRLVATGATEWSVIEANTSYSD